MTDGERRRIALFTSSRADLGPLGSVIAALDAEEAVDLTVIATGTHSNQAYGGRLADIAVSDRSRVKVIDAEITGTDPSELTEAFGRIATGVSAVLATGEADFLVLLGDRWELLAAASAALLHGVPIAHLHGGETTEGAMDERIRHGITKLADLHLCASVDSARRIRHLGEEPWRIVVTGAPGLDRMASVEPLSDEEIEDLLGSPLRRPFGVVVYHPPTVDRAAVSERARAVLDAASEELASVLVLYPGADPGATAVITEIEAAAGRHDHVAAVRNLGSTYLRVLKSADVLVGNSSSGIIEAVSLELPVVDVGDRQRGRLRAGNVVQAAEDEPAVGAAIRQALAPDFRRSLSGMANPYGDGSSAVRIARALLDAPLDRLLQKPLMEAEASPPPVESMTISPTATLRDAVEAIDRGRSQIALVISDEGRLVGTISDGDVRRALLADASLESSIEGHVSLVPVVASQTDDRERVLALMHRTSVTQIPVVDPDGVLVGMHVMRAVVSELANEATPLPW